MAIATSTALHRQPWARVRWRADVRVRTRRASLRGRRAPLLGDRYGIPLEKGLRARPFREGPRDRGDDRSVALRHRRQTRLRGRASARPAPDVRDVARAATLLVLALVLALARFWWTEGATASMRGGYWSAGSGGGSGLFASRGSAEVCSHTGFRTLLLNRLAIVVLTLLRETVAPDKCTKVHDLLRPETAVAERFIHGQLGPTQRSQAYRRAQFDMTRRVGTRD